MKSRAPIASGTRQTFHGVDVVAVSLVDSDTDTQCRVGTARCPFYEKPECLDTKCDGLIWLTVPDYITRRLKS